MITFGTTTQTNCKHLASVKMPGYKDKKECLTCHKIYDFE
jgi:hypothetical protein